MAEQTINYNFWLLIAVIVAIVVCKCTSYYFDYKLEKARNEYSAQTTARYCDILEKAQKDCKKMQGILELLQR